MFYISQQATVPNAKVRPRERRDETAGARGAQQETCECVTITARSTAPCHTSEKIVVYIYYLRAAKGFKPFHHVPNVALSRAYLSRVAFSAAARVVRVAFSELPLVALRCAARCPPCIAATRCAL